MDQEALEALNALALDIETMEEPKCVHSPDQTLLKKVLRDLDALALEGAEQVEDVGAILADLRLDSADDAVMTEEEAEGLEADIARQENAEAARSEAYEEQSPTSDLILPASKLTVDKARHGVNRVEEKRATLRARIADTRASLECPAVPPPDAPLAERNAYFRALWGENPNGSERQKARHRIAGLEKQLDGMDARKVKDRDRKRLKAKKAPSIPDRARARLSALKNATAGKRDKSMGQLKGRETFHVRVWACREVLRLTCSEPSLSRIALAVSRYYPEPVTKPQVQRSVKTIAALEASGVWK